LYLKQKQKAQRYACVFSAIAFLLVYFANCIAFELLALQIGLAMGVVNTAAGDAVMQNAPMTQESQQSTYSNRNHRQQRRKC
jgi:hypothetical protein